MDASPDIHDTATGTASNAEAALAQLRHAVLAIDSRQPHWPLVLSNAPASRYFGSNSHPLAGLPLQQLLGSGAAAPVKAALASLGESHPTTRRVIAWRHAQIETLLPTEFKLLETPAGERWVLLSFTASGPGLPDAQIAEREQWERDLLQIALRERQRIGCDLHDGLGQELTGVALMLAGVAKKIHLKCPELSGSIGEVAALVNQSIDSVRDVARGLLPVSAQPGGLETALRELAVRSRDTHGLTVYCCTDVHRSLSLSDTQASHLYRIAQEALANAARHGQAKVVDVLLVITHHMLLLRIADDGCGLARDSRPAGMGLKIMEYRAGMLGARLEVCANLPRGTVVRVIGEAPQLALRL